jgi:hypothetical protein
MRSYETRKAVLLKLFSELYQSAYIIVLIRIDYDVYDLACIQLFFCVIDM